MPLLLPCGPYCVWKAWPWPRAYHTCTVTWHHVLLARYLGCSELLRAYVQELVEVVGRSSGVVLMAPPTESAEAAASVSTLLSTLKSKQKVSRAPSDQ